MYIPVRVAFIIIMVFGLVAGWFALPASFLDIGGVKANHDLRRGLDLQGGLQVLLKANPPAGVKVDANTLSGTRDTVERRVSALGVSEPRISTLSTDQILVELPGVQDPERAVNTLQQTALLEVIDPQGQYLPPGTTVTTSLGGPDTVGDAAATPGATGATPIAGGTPQAVTAPGATPAAGSPIAAGTPTAGTPAAATTGDTSTPNGPVYTTIMTGKDISNATPANNNVGAPVVRFDVKGDGVNALQKFTRDNVGKYMTIVVDKKVISSATIQDVLSNNVEVSGLTAVEAQDLAVQLRAGSLQVPLTVESSNTVGPSLGGESIKRSLIAGIVGLATVALFMIIFYRIPGLLSVVALLIYTAVSICAFKLFGVTMTLAGIAGFILSIGMAVDANVLIFARLRDELRVGHTLGRAVEQAFRNAFPSIRDSNTSTLITCAILWYFGNQTGTSLMTGFAITLAIGVIVSFLTAVTITRNFMRITISSGRVRDPWYLGIERGEAQAMSVGTPAASGD